MAGCIAHDGQSLGMDRGRKMSLSLVVLLACVLVQFATGYQLVLEGMEVHKKGVSREYLEWQLARLGRLNRSSTLIVLNVKGKVLLDFPDEAWIDMIAYELLATNAYSKIPVRIMSGPVCKFLAEERFFYDDMLRYSNFPSKCPIEKGDYYITDYLPNMDFFPPELPGERWRMDFTVKANQKGDILMKLSFFGYIDRRTETQAGSKIQRTRG